MDTFTVRDLPRGTGELYTQCEYGADLSVITKLLVGRFFVAVPFDELLIREGIRLALAAASVSASRKSPLGKAARLWPGWAKAEFLAELGSPGDSSYRRERNARLNDELHQFRLNQDCWVRCGPTDFALRQCCICLHLPARAF